MRVCEVYTSIQGEGPNVGRVTTFIRFGGCNLRCRGWGEGTLPDGTVVPGCDTTFAVYPAWLNTWEKVGQIEALLADHYIAPHVCLTGGEPFLQPKDELKELVDQLLTAGHSIDVFTNGMYAIDTVSSLFHEGNVQFIMDYKLPGSHEYGSFNPRNWKLATDIDVIKFTCADRLDFDTAVSDWIVNARHGTPYFGPVWGKLDPSLLAEWIMITPELVTSDTVRMQVQTHKYIWKPEERRV